VTDVHVGPPHPTQPEEPPPDVGAGQKPPPLEPVVEDDVSAELALPPDDDEAGVMTTTGPVGVQDHNNAKTPIQPSRASIKSPNATRGARAIAGFREIVCAIHDGASVLVAPMANPTFTR
jgi:hypothetical protein